MSTKVGFTTESHSLPFAKNSAYDKGKKGKVLRKKDWPKTCFSMLNKCMILRSGENFLHAFTRNSINVWCWSSPLLCNKPWPFHSSPYVYSHCLLFRQLWLWKDFSYYRYTSLIMFLKIFTQVAQPENPAFMLNFITLTCSYKKLHPVLYQVFSC